jgi:hypothetical protein
MSLLYHLGKLLIFTVRLIHGRGGCVAANAADRYRIRKVGLVGMLEFLDTGGMATATSTQRCTSTPA